MKRILLLVCFLFIAGFFSAQLTQSENYISSTTYLDSVNIKKVQTVQYFDGLGRLKQAVNVKASPLGNDIVNLVEYDQFGRQVKDYLPIPQSSSQTGGFYSNPLSNIGSIPSYVGEKIYAEKKLEYSPLDRIQQQFQVGNDWNLNPVTFDYQANSKINDKVKKYNFLTSWGTDNATDHGLPISTLYDDNQLYKNSVKDEDGNESIEFKNGHGQTILVRKVLSPTENVDSYYVYNDYNQLAYVIPPLAAIIPVLTQTDLNNLCYQYRYDGKGRLVEKRLPGKGLEYMVYDNQDRLIMTQDTKLKTAGLWLFTKYDQFGRVAFTGITAADLNSSRSGEQTNANNSGSNNVFRSSTSIIDYSDLKLFYTVANSYPGSTNISKLLSVNYYDFYPTGNDSYSGDGVDLPIKPVSIQGKYTLGDDFSKKKSTKGLPVASYVNSIEGNTWTKSFTWYDQKGRSIGTHTINYIGGYTKTESILDFTGIPQKIFTAHKRSGLNYGTVNIEETFGYDNQNRLKKHEHNVNNKPIPEILAENTYNEIGQLEIKKVGGTGTPLQTVNYKYNIRGWITDVNNPANPTTMGTDLFGYTIRYTSRMGLQTPDVLGHPSLQVMPKYNGNIAEIDWNAVDETGVPPQSQPYRYGYVYDALNRLQAGFYQDPYNPSKGTNNEIIEEYDLNGNIKKLKRFAYRPKSIAPAKIDDLTYLYNGNQVTNIADTGNSSGYEGGNGLIEYDANGNMIKMPDKGITNIVYNYLNLPQEIAQTNNTKYSYLANGVKIKKSYTLNNATGAHISNTEYLDGFQYITNVHSVAQAFKQTDDNTLSAKTAGEEEVFVESEELIPIAYQGMILSFFPTAEGFYNYSKQQYIYQYKDHLGNVRLSYTKNATTGQLDIPDRNDYYPFGMNFVGYHSVFDALGTPYNYKFQGQELQETGFYSFKWRNYMPDVGRFFNIDPLAEKYPYNSTYAFQENKMGLGRELEGLELIGWAEIALFSDSNIKPVMIESLTKTGETSEALSKVSEGVQKSNERVKYESDVERAQDKMDGIERAQENLKKNTPRGSKQNAIESTKKSSQNFDNILKRLKNSSDVDQFDVKIPPIKRDNLVVPKPQPIIPNFTPKKEKPNPNPNPSPPKPPDNKKKDNYLWS